MICLMVPSMNSSFGIRGPNPPQMIDEKLLALLACPACQGDVVLKDDQIVCLKCRRIYPIVDGIPVLLVDPTQS